MFINNTKAAAMMIKIRIFSIIILLSAAVNTAAGKKDGYSTEVSPKTLKLHKEKLTRIQLYWHDTVAGRKPSSVAVLPSLKNGSMFGLVHMFDNPLSVGPNLTTSAVVGRSQGLYASTALDQVGLLMAMNFALTQGKYKGSTITILGRNTILQTVRELSVIGGSGRFRFARGFALANTYYFNPATFDAIVHYDIHVLHY